MLEEGRGQGDPEPGERSLVVTLTDDWKRTGEGYPDREATFAADPCAALRYALQHLEGETVAASVRALKARRDELLARERR